MPFCHLHLAMNCLKISTNTAERKLTVLACISATQAGWKITGFGGNSQIFNGKRLFFSINDTDFICCCPRLKKINQCANECML